MPFSVVRGKEFREFVDVTEIENVSAIEVGRSVAGAQIERIVAVIEETHAALFVGGMGVGVGEAELQSVAHALFDVSLERVVRGDAGRSVAL